MTLENFLYKEKMSRAAFLLKTHNGIKVKEVSEIIGFCTCDYFIRKFKEFYGLLPGKYKEFKAGAADQENNNLEAESYQDQNDNKNAHH